jgi:hypothetical protein
MEKRNFCPKNVILEQFPDSSFEFSISRHPDPSCRGGNCVLIDPATILIGDTWKRSRADRAGNPAALK